MLFLADAYFWKLVHKDKLTLVLFTSWNQAAMLQGSARRHCVEFFNLEKITISTLILQVQQI
jgi:hypothetical protein